MTQDIDATDTNAPDETPVIKALRTQIKDLEKELKARPDRETVEAEVFAKLERQTAIGDQLIGLGHPKGMSAILAEKMGESDVTRDSVVAALQGLGYQVDTSEAASKPDSSEQARSDLADVTSLSSQVSAAASNVPSDDTMYQIGQTKNRQELVAVMREKGLTADYTGK